ncbi:MAG: DinB family protein [Bryobacteraceae bacterium]
MTTLRLLITPVTLVFLTLPLAGQAQPAAPANPLTADARDAWGFVKTYVLRAAEKMPEADYAFKPVPEVRSFGQLIAHIVVTQNEVCAEEKGAAKPNAQLDKATKAGLIAALKASDAYCDTAFAGLTDAQAAERLKLYGESRTRLAAFYMLSFHGYEHYGNIVTYMRLKGLVPPTSEPPK